MIVGAALAGSGDTDGPVVMEGPVVSDAVTVKVADFVLENESVATTVCAPTEEAGTVKVVDAGIAPPLVVVTVTWVTPSYFIVVEELAAKPEPVTVTTVAAGPLDGLRDIDEAFTVNVAVPDLPVASVALTVWEPNAEAGTVKVVDAGIAPPEVVVKVSTVLP